MSAWIVSKKRARAGEGASMKPCTVCGGEREHDSYRWSGIPPYHTMKHERVRCRHCQGTGVEPVQRRAEIVATVITLASAVVAAILGGWLFTLKGMPPWWWYVGMAVAMIAVLTFGKEDRDGR